ncbi:hypothetical protein [Kineosporia succinea]|uniref:Uncharacterized protein n=1 Tax=Kineosporia succinea TaxID=84632 RepID=A0ABT9PBP4_9ACTN|nr:hypothetical protein [Kineosporia succinea]MDP9830124.1 hypothetical protein [Kineosporia succinea]
MDADTTDAVRLLRELHADRTRAPMLSAYVAALTDDAGWGVETIASLLGTSRQTISGKRKQGRELRSGLVKELRGLPLPAAPPKETAGHTRSGLRVPDEEAIMERETAWAVRELGGAATASEVPARLRLAAGVANEADGRLVELRQQRAELAWVLTCFDPGARRGLQKAGHWQPDEFFAARTKALLPPAELKARDDDGLRKLAAERGIRLDGSLDEVRERYFAVASSIIAAQVRRRVVTQIRDDLVRRHVKRDAAGRWKGVTEVAGWIGRSQAQVTQICDAGEGAQRPG